ncbi:MAG: tyrosine-type recombinase/integrase [Gemmataceae bacterium]
MARAPRVWFRRQTGWYMTTLNGQQVKLSKERKEAERAFHQILATEPEPEETGGVRPSFKRLADLFLDNSLRENEPGTWAVQRFYLQSFSDHVGKKRAADLKVHHGTEWIVAHPEWSSSTCTTARKVIRACLNWAVDQGYVPTNPLQKLKRGDFTRRDRVLSPSERKRILGWLTGDIRDFVYTLEQTGARPFSEVAAITADMVDFKAGTVTFLKHKNAKRGKRRVIYLTGRLVALFRKLALRHPEGPLFRTRTGRPWSKGVVLKWMRKVESALDIPRLTPYAWRHTMITDSLAKGMSADIVAELVGNSPATIAKYYSHLDQRQDVLRAAARRAVS